MEPHPGWPVTLRHGNDDPPAVGIGDVVEAKKVTRAPTNPRASAIVGQRLDLDLVRLLGRDDAEESVAGYFGVEVSGSPRNEVGY